MELSEAIGKRRSIRLFRQKEVEESKLRELLEAARFAPSGGNEQVLRYIVVREKKTVDTVFPLTAWAYNVKPHRNPEPGKTAPTAFIAVLGPDSSAKKADAGAAIQNMLLKAVELGLGCCWLGSIKANEIGKILQVPEDLNVLYLIAIGYPDEEPQSEDIGKGDSTKYYLDSDGKLHVPKYITDAISQWR